METKSFGQWLRHRRRELDLTQEELAHQVGCAPITIRKIEAEEMRPSKQLAGLLGERLGVLPTERGALVKFARGGEPLPSDTPEAPKDNLPHPVSTFIGREREITDIQRFLGASRLVTLTGAGGCGKSRLAIEAARQMLDQYPDGIWFAALAPVTDAALVQRTLASALRVREDPSRPPIETLCDYLRSKHLLLVFDNCEHLIGECAQTAETLLQACPQLRILVTSREALNISGEEHYYVPCLSLPEVGETSVERLGHSEAARLFVDRAARARGAFTLEDSNLRPVADICRRLDGMPLAIELAAARVKVLSVQHIAERLDDRFSLLTGGDRTALPRHQTLRATIEWSYDLLPEKARVLFARLSVFAGGFTQEAAEAVCSDGRLAPGDVLTELTRLVDRSLVEVVNTGQAERYRMLETIRQFAQERLGESGEEGHRRGRHLSFFTDWMQGIEPKLRGPEQAIWWDRIETEHDNIRGALRCALSGGDAQCGLRLASAMYWYWYPRSDWIEGRRWVVAILERIPEEVWTPARAKAAAVAAALALDLSPIDAFRDDYPKCIQYWDEAGDDWWSAFSRVDWGWRFVAASDPVAGRRWLEEAVAYARKSRDDWILGHSLRSLGAAVMRIDLAASRPILEEGMGHIRATGDRFYLADHLNQMTILLLGQGEYAAAAALAEEALGIYREKNIKAASMAPIWSLMYAMLGLGKVDRAAEIAGEGLQLGRNLGYLAYIAFGVMGHGYVAAARARFRRSVILLVASEAALNSVGISELSYAVWRSFYERNLANARAQLGESEFNKAVVEGHAMALEQAVEYALEARTEEPKARG